MRGGSPTERTLKGRVVISRFRKPTHGYPTSAPRTALAERLALLERGPVLLVVDLSRIEDDWKPDFMTRYELRKIVSHHQDWLRGEREGIVGGVYAANQRGHIGAIERNLGPAPSTPRAQRQGIRMLGRY